MLSDLIGSGVTVQVVRNAVFPYLDPLPCPAHSRKLNDSPCLFHAPHFHDQHFGLHILGEGNDARVEGVAHQFVTSTAALGDEREFGLVVPDQAGSCSGIMRRRDVRWVGNDHIVFCFFPQALFREDIALDEIDMR